jgi:hypothetical protein
LPTLFVLFVTYWLFVRGGERLSQHTFIQGGVVLVGGLAAAVGARAIN